MARNNDRRMNENYEPPFDAAGYKPGSPKMKRIEGSGSGVVGGERRQLKGGHGGTEQTHPKNKNRVNDKGVVAGSETSSSHGEATDGFQERVGHDWPDGPENDGASGEFITGYDYTGAAPEPTLEGWNPASIGSMIGEEYNLQDMFNQYAGTRRSVNMQEFKNVCRANGFDYPLSEDMFRQLIENNKEFVFTEHHDGIHRFYISESDMGMGFGPSRMGDGPEAGNYHGHYAAEFGSKAKKYGRDISSDEKNALEKHKQNDSAYHAKMASRKFGSTGQGFGGDMGMGLGVNEDDLFELYEQDPVKYAAYKKYDPALRQEGDTPSDLDAGSYDPEEDGDGSCGGLGEGSAWGGSGEDDYEAADLDYGAPTPNVPFPGKPNNEYDGPADIDVKSYHKNPGHELYEKPEDGPETTFDDADNPSNQGYGLGGAGDEEGGCACAQGGECKCPPFCKKCKHASGSCGGGKCGSGKKDMKAEGLERQLTRFFTEARSIIKENARYGRRIIGAKLNESWDRSAGYCRITNSKQKVGQALSMLKNRYPSFNPLFENTQEVMKTGYMIDKAEGKKTEEGGKEPSMSDFTEVIGKGLNNRQPKNGLTGKPKEYPK